MLRTLAETFAALARRSVEARRPWASARLGVERLEERSLLSATTGGAEMYVWQFEYGPIDRHDTFNESAARVSRDSYMPSNWGPADFGDRGYGDMTRVPPRDSYVSSSYSSRPDPPLAGRAVSSGAPHSVYDAPPMRSMTIIYFVEIDETPPPPPPKATSPSASPWGSVGGSPTADGPTIQSVDRTGGGVRAGTSNAQKYNDGPQPSYLRAPSAGADKSLMEFSGNDSFIVSPQSVQESQEGTASDKSRLLRTLESHDAVFQALAMQTTGMRLRGTGTLNASDLNGDASESELKAADQLVQGVEGESAASSLLRDLRDSAESSSTRDIATVERLVDAMRAAHRADRRVMTAATHEESASSADATQAVENHSGDSAPEEGGMVLLRAVQGRGDARAVDAAMAMEGGASRTSMEMDAGVGGYQAFVVGTKESGAAGDRSAPRVESSVSTEPARQAASEDGAPTRVPLAIAAGAAVLGAWSATPRSGSQNRRRLVNSPRR